VSEYDSAILGNERGWDAGLDERTGSLFSYVGIEDRVPAKHPLRVIRRIVNDVLAALDGEFAKIPKGNDRVVAIELRNRGRVRRGTATMWRWR
jgi:hypothetical protein